MLLNCDKVAVKLSSDVTGRGLIKGTSHVDL